MEDIRILIFFLPRARCRWFLGGFPKYIMYFINFFIQWSWCIIILLMSIKCFSNLPLSSLLIFSLYHDKPHFFNPSNYILYNMQSLGHACILSLVQNFLFTSPYMPRLARNKAYNGAVAFLQFQISFRPRFS